MGRLDERVFLFRRGYFRLGGCEVRQSAKGCPSGGGEVSWTGCIVRETGMGFVNMEDGF